MTNPLLRDFLFRAIASEIAVDELEKEGLSVRAAEDQRAAQRILPIDEFSEQIRRAAMRAMPAYLAFFCLENAVRELLLARLLENHGADWWEKKVSRKIQDKVNVRRDREGQNRWHVSRGEHAIFYTDFSDLRSIFENNWDDFEDLFPDQSWITTRLSELELSRNIIAHSNRLDDREVDRLRIYLEDWLKQVG